MRKRVIIEIDANILDEKKIVDKISYAAMKVLRANRGNLVGIRQEEVMVERPSRMWIPSTTVENDDWMLQVMGEVRDR